MAVADERVPDSLANTVRFFDPTLTTAPKTAMSVQPVLLPSSYGSDSGCPLAYRGLGCGQRPHNLAVQGRNPDRRTLRRYPGRGPRPQLCPSANAWSIWHCSRSGKVGRTPRTMWGKYGLGTRNTDNTDFTDYTEIGVVRAFPRCTCSAYRVIRVTVLSVFRVIRVVSRSRRRVRGPWRRCRWRRLCGTRARQGTTPET